MRKQIKIISEAVMRLLKCLFGSTFFKTFVCLLVVATPSLAFAADGWDSVFKNTANTFNALKSLIVIGAYLIGTGLALLGLWFIYKDGKEENRGHMKNGIISLVIGSLMLIFPQTVGWTVGTAGAQTSNIADDNFDTSF